jgi:hypothetical protein
VVGQTDLWMVSEGGRGERTPFERTPARDLMGEFSPDGRWIAYGSAESGRPEVYVRRVGSTGRRQVSALTGFEPRWSPDGRSIYYRSSVGDFYRVAVVPGEELGLGAVERLFAGMRAGDLTCTYAVARHGERFLVLGLAPPRRVDRVVLDTGWGGEVARMVSARR